MSMQTAMLSFSLRVVGGVAVALLVGAYASPEPTLYALLARSETTDTSRFWRAFRLSGVRVPDRLDKPQVALRTFNNEVVAPEQQRWIVPFGSKLRDALSVSLTTTLSAVDVGSAAAPAGISLYRIGAEMRSYDARPGQGVTALVTRRISRDVTAQGANTAALICQTILVLPVSRPPVAVDSETDVNAMMSPTQRLIQQRS